MELENKQEYKSKIVLENLYLDNFKSFRKSKFEFGKLNCLIAPNNSGKSNLIQALKFLDNLIYQNNAVAIFECGGIKNIKNFYYEESKTVVNATFKIKNRVLHLDEFIDYDIKLLFLYSMDWESKKHNIDIMISGKVKSVQIDKNDLDNVTDRIIDNFSENIDNYTSYIELLEKQNYRSFDFTYNNNTLVYSLDTRFETTKKIIENLFVLRFDKKENNKLQSFLQFSYIFSKNSLFSSYYFQANEMKKPEVLGDTKLAENGKNLPEYLVHLYSKDKILFEDISTSLIGEVALVNSIEVRDDSIPELIFQEELNGKNYPVSIQTISDGTLHFLAIISALLGDDVSQGIMIEEPERHIHMKVLSYILNTMRDDDKQIFFTTHSTEILNELELDEIIFMFRDYEGDTKGQRAKDIVNIKKIMKRYKNDLAEMIRCGIVGEYDE